jgi:hypothetical protein
MFCLSIISGNFLASCDEGSGGLLPDTSSGNSYWLPEKNVWPAGENPSTLFFACVSALHPVMRDQGCGFLTQVQGAEWLPDTLSADGVCFHLMYQSMIK